MSHMWLLFFWIEERSVSLSLFLKDFSFRGRESPPIKQINLAFDPETALRQKELPVTQGPFCRTPVAYRILFFFNWLYVHTLLPSSYSVSLKFTYFHFILLK